jgi:hypothetical protein
MILFLSINILAKKECRQSEKKDDLVKAVGIILGGIGALTLIDAIFPDNGWKKDI